MGHIDDLINSSRPKVHLTEGDLCFLNGLLGKYLETFKEDIKNSKAPKEQIDLLKQRFKECQSLHDRIDKELNS